MRKRELADVLEHDHLEQAVVEHRVRAPRACRRRRPSSWRRRPSSRVKLVALARRVELDLEARRAPGERARAARRRRTRGRRATAGASLAMRLASLSKPTEAMPDERPAAAAPHRRRAPRRGPSRAGRRRRSSRTPPTASSGMPSTRARSLPRPPGSTPEHRAGDVAQRVGERADHAVAAERHDRLAARPPPRGQLARVVEVARVARGAPSSPCSRSARSTSGASAAGLAAAGGWVDDQADGCGHEASVVSARDAGAARSRQDGAARRPLCARSRRRRPIAATTPSTAITTNRPEQDARREPEPAERQRDELDDAEADREQHDDQHDDQQDAADAREDAGGGGRDEQAHRAQREHLAAARRRLAEALDGVLEVAGAAFGERERRVGHAPDLHPLLRARGGDRALEVAARGLGVEALGRRARRGSPARPTCIWSRPRAPRRSAARAPGSPRAPPRCSIRTWRCLGAIGRSFYGLCWRRARGRRRARRDAAPCARHAAGGMLAACPSRASPRQSLRALACVLLRAAHAGRSRSLAAAAPARSPRLRRRQRAQRTDRRRSPKRRQTTRPRRATSTATDVEHELAHTLLHRARRGASCC